MEKYTEEEYEKAKNYVAYYRTASIMGINRHITKNYIKAAQIIDRLEDEGHIGPYRGYLPRKILIERPIDYGWGI